MRLNNIKKVLIIKLREIGDLLLTTPVISAIKDTYPDSSVSILVNSGTEDIVTGNPLIDKVYIFDRSLKSAPLFDKIKKQVSFAKEVREGHFDLVADFTGGDRAAIYALCSGARYKVGFDKLIKKGFKGKGFIYTHTSPYPSCVRHEVEKNLDLLRPFGIDTQKKSPQIFFGEEDKAAILKIFKDNNIREDDIVVHIHPTSKWLFKCWEDNSFAEVIDYISRRYNGRVIITSGISDKEREKGKGILRLSKSSPIFIQKGLTLKKLAALSSLSDLFIGVDTGPMHIAASTGTPVIVMFGPSGPLQWGPWGEGHHILTSKEFPCMPCGSDGCNGTKRSKCLEAITVAMVREKVDYVLQKI